MRLSTLTQRSELKAAEDRHEMAGPLAVIALIVAAALALGGHWIAALGFAATGGFLFVSTAMEVRAAGDPDATEAFYRLADPRTPLELPAAAPPGDAASATDGPIE
ncbi:MAG TPA: hypothetical protein VGB15_12900 [Longimicrobium sp.]|jgi:hypothetical protein